MTRNSIGTLDTGSRSVTETSRSCFALLEKYAPVESYEPRKREGLSSVGLSAERVRELLGTPPRRKEVKAMCGEKSVMPRTLVKYLPLLRWRARDVGKWNRERLEQYCEVLGLGGEAGYSFLYKVYGTINPPRAAVRATVKRVEKLERSRGYDAA